MGSGTLAWGILTDIVHTYVANGSIEPSSQEEAWDIHSLCFREEWFSKFPGDSAREKALFPNPMLARRSLIGSLYAITRSEFDESAGSDLVHMARILEILSVQREGTYGSVRYHILRCLATTHPLQWASTHPITDRGMCDVLTVLRTPVTLDPDKQYWDLHTNVVCAARNYCMRAAENGPDDWIVRNHVMFLFHVAFLRSCAHALHHYRDVMSERSVVETQRHIQVFIQYLYNLMGR